RRDWWKRPPRRLTSACHIPDVRVFIREYQAENVGQDGRLRSEPLRPVCFIVAPQLRRLDARRKLTEKINAAVADAYEGIANTRETPIFHNEYPLENECWVGRLQSDNPQIVKAMKMLIGACPSVQWGHSICFLPGAQVG